MVTEDEIRKCLEGVLIPSVMRNLLMLNLVRGISISDQDINITLASTGLNPREQDWVRSTTKTIVGKLPDVNKVEVEFIEVKPVEINQINQVIAVMSGKGGVGKSVVASLIAVALKRQGYEVGILDADVTGPSIPKMFGVTARPGGSETGILPVLSRSGIEVMSFNLLLPHEDDAVIWRGPLLSRAITQFWEDVVWGKLNYLIVDVPPGTADIPLTVMQSLPVSGVIIVFTPQSLTTMIVRKAVNMAHKLNKLVLGVVENMSYLYIPEIDKRIELFGKSRGEEMAQVANAPFLGQLPVDPELGRLCDEGGIEYYNSDAFTSFSQAFTQALPKAGMEQPAPEARQA